MQDTFARSWAQLSRSPSETALRVTHHHARAVSAAIGAADSAVFGGGSATANDVAVPVAALPDIPHMGAAGLPAGVQSWSDQ